MRTTETITERVAKAVEEGLFRENKFLPSWLFYDDNGDRIFQEIMHMPEYYLTNCEFEILKNHKDDILKRFGQNGPFQLIELGAGDGLKTEILLKHFHDRKINFSYHPIDISASVLMQLQERLQQSIPNLDYKSHQGDYTQALEQLNLTSHERKVILFLGSNIGNFSFPDAVDFITSIGDTMFKGDLLFMGIDLKKDPALIKKAYDDPNGITKKFNLNLLNRLNAELGANFKLDAFDHAPVYDPNTGEAISYLISLQNQEVYFDSLGKKLALKKGEKIHTEVSLKYDQAMIRTLSRETGLSIVHQYYDKEKFFCDLLLVRS